MSFEMDAMRILWVVNIIFPYPAEKIAIAPQYSGGWLLAFAEGIRNLDWIKLAIATVYSGKEVKHFSDGSIEYYLLPGGRHAQFHYWKGLEKIWKSIIYGFSPDIIHIHGTEYSHSLPLFVSKEKIPTILSIQGLINPYSKHYLGGIGILDIIKNMTIRDMLKFDNILMQRARFRMRSNGELHLLRNVDYIIGRTRWDYAHVRAMNLKAKYFHCNESLREEFYESTWDIEHVERHSIFASQAVYPIKGLHFLLEAAYLLAKSYEDIKIYVAGPNIAEKNIRRPGYGKILCSLIKRYHLNGSVVFTGILKAEEIAERLSRAHTFVLPSSIENSPNSLGEAMVVGTPIVAAYVGGVPDLLTHGKEGFLYQFDEPAIMAYYIASIWNDDRLAESISHESRIRGRETHKRSANLSTLVDIYNQVLNVGQRTIENG